MEFIKMMKAKIEQQTTILNKALAENRALTEDEQSQIDALEVEIKNLEKSIEMQNRIDAREVENKKPVNDPLFAQPKDHAGIKVFKNLTSQLKAVKAFATTGRVDERLNRLNNEFKNATGMSEGVGSDGGFPVQTDFAGMMMDSAAKEGQILSRVDSYEVGALSNGVEWIDIDEESVATTVFGGVQVYWASEAATVAASKPKLIDKNLKLEKLLGFAYATYELNEDSNFIDQLYTRAFRKGIRRALESSIVSGSGVGQMEGILKSGSKIAIAKESGQEAATILWKNLSKMYNRSRDYDDDQNYVWLAHPDCAEQFDFLEFPIGTGGVPVYLPAAQQGAVTTLKGKPVLKSDQCSAIGTEGDVIYTDLNDYFMIYKGGITQESSIHVAFLTAENCFRFIFRANGMPKHNKTLTIKNSSNARSSIITLATRA